MFIYHCHGNHTENPHIKQEPGASVDIENMNQFKLADIENLVPGQCLYIYILHQVKNSINMTSHYIAADTGMQSSDGQIHDSASRVES